MDRALRARAAVQQEGLLQWRQAAIQRAGAGGRGRGGRQRLVQFVDDEQPAAPVQAQRAVLQQHGLEFVGGFAVPGGDLGQPCAQRVDGALAAGGAVGQGELWERRTRASHSGPTSFRKRFIFGSPTDPGDIGQWEQRQSGAGCRQSRCRCCRRDCDRFRPETLRPRLSRGCADRGMLGARAARVGNDYRALLRLRPRYARAASDRLRRTCAAWRARSRAGNAPPGRARGSSRAGVPGLRPGARSGGSTNRPGPGC